MGQGGAGWGWGWARHRPLWRDQERTIQLLCPPQKKCLINGNTHTHTLKNVRLANVEYRSMLRLLTAILYGNPAATVLPGGGGPTGSISPQERNKRQVTTAFPSARPAPRRGEKTRNVRTGGETAVLPFCRGGRRGLLDFSELLARADTRKSAAFLHAGSSLVTGGRGNNSTLERRLRSQHPCGAPQQMHQKSCETLWRKQRDCVERQTPRQKGGQLCSLPRPRHHRDAVLSRFTRPWQFQF